MARTKVALIYVGGSIGMKVNKKTGRIEPIESINEIHQLLPELQREVALEFFTISNLGSSEVTPDHWIDLANLIEQIYDRFEGFVIIHGTNTMSYTASALSFALQGLSKPVILVGALLPINDLEGDGRMNLIYAMRAAQLDIAEVCVVMGPRVLRGTRAKKVDQSILQSFDSPKHPPLAEFHMDVHLNNWRYVRRKRKLVCKPVFDPEVVVLTLQPGLNNKYLSVVLDANPHGIILRSYGQGMVPEHLFPWVQEVTKKNIPLVFTSQMVRGVVDLHRYRKQLTLEQLGIISGKDMSFECAAVKLMWALGQTNNVRRIREIMEKNLVGELDE